MPTAVTDTKGNYIHYEDSGSSSDAQTLTTIIFVHGYSFNSATFRRLLPLASKHGLRIFTMNMRDYRGSSEYSAEELADMSSTDVERQAAALQQFGRDIAGFVAYICRTKGVPEIIDDGERRTGGVILVTWSMSNMALMAFLGDPNTLDDETRTVLQSYLRRVVVYDPACTIFGVYPETQLHFPLWSKEVSEAQKPAAFAQWVSSYYEAVSDSASVTPETLHNRCVLTDKIPSVCTLTPEEYDETFEPTVIARSGLLSTFLPDLYHRNLCCALLDADAVLPNVDVVFLWCDQSMWLCIWSVRVLQDLSREELSAGRKRPLSIIKLEKANHFIHWEDPERFLSVIKEITE